MQRFRKHLRAEMFNVVSLQSVFGFGAEYKLKSKRQSMELEKCSTHK